MKTAFSVWEQRIAPVFDTARQIHLVESTGTRITAEKAHAISGENVPQMVAWLSEQGVCTLVCGAVSRPLQEGNTLKVTLDKTDALASVGGSVKIIDARLPTPVIIARTGETEYAAVSLLCPHRGVEVDYRHADKQFRCASLGHSKFGTDGTLKKGLTKKSLSRYTAALDPADKNRLVVTL